MLMNGLDPRRWLKDARLAIARLPSFRLSRAPAAPALPVRDPWPGDPAAGVRLLKGEFAYAGGVRPLQPGLWIISGGSPLLHAEAHGFTWLRDLRALGSDAARLRARALVTDWIASASQEPIANLPEVIGARIAAWLGHYDFFAASADDAFRQRLMGRLIADARILAALLPPEALDRRALVALKGLIAAAVALPEHAFFLTRALRFLPQVISQQILPDGSHAERSPAAQLAALQELVEIRALLQGAQVQLPPALLGAIEKSTSVLRALRHADGALALFNGSKEGNPALIDLVLSQAGRGSRAASPGFAGGGFQRLQGRRTVMIVDCGTPPAPGFDRFAHAGTLSFELSVGRDRVIVNCGAAPAAGPEWQDAARATAAHSTLVIADTNSAELRPDGLGRKPEKVIVEHQEANGAHWLEVSHDGWLKPFGALHRRRLYMAESGEDIRGEDSVEAGTPQPFVVRFHLHPTVNASFQQDAGAVLLRLPHGGGWRLRAEGARMSLEESVYLGGAEPHRTEQIVLTAAADGPQIVKWAITKVG